VSAPRHSAPLMVMPDLLRRLGGDAQAALVVDAILSRDLAETPQPLTLLARLTCLQPQDVVVGLAHAEKAGAIDVTWRSHAPGSTEALAVIVQVHL
jgi:hypothetical protein